MDIWRVHNPEAWQYSCFSRTCSTLPRIDLVLGNEEALHVIKNVNYMPRGLSDRSPMILSVELRESCRPREWKISPFWMELMGEPNEILTALREFVDLNRGTTSLGVVWYTLKAFLQGIIVQQVSKMKKWSGKRLLGRGWQEWKNNM